MAPRGTIIELASIISHNTEILDAYYASKDVPTPSFQTDKLFLHEIPPFDEEAAAAQFKILSATIELHSLVKGPAQQLIELATVEPNSMLSLHAISRLDIASKIPLDGEVSYQFLSTACGLNKRDLRRLIRHAMTNHIFKERDGLVTHTAASKLLAQDPSMRQLVEIQTEEYFPSACRAVDALLKHNGTHSPNQSGFSLGHNTSRGLYAELHEFPNRSHRFAGAMAAFAARLPVEPIANGFKWAPCTKVVDVGGGWGPVSIGLAEIFPGVEFVVQDYGEIVADGRSKVTSTKVAERVEFMAYDFLTEQPVHDADVYFFRAIFHNWPDEYCIKILRNQIPALKKGAHILISETISSESNNQSLYLEKFTRSMDLAMLAYFGGLDRSEEEWRELVESTDSRLMIKSVMLPPGGAQHLIDIVMRD